MKFKGTPGPWVNVGGWVDSKGEHSKIICAISSVSMQTEDIQESNANLIAAAPELLEALQAVVRVADRETVEFHMARAAIAKAIGKGE